MSIKTINFVGDGVTATRNVDTVEVTIPGGAGAWGGITGTLSDQTDLQAALDSKGSGMNLYNVETYGAVHDGQIVFAGVTNGLATITAGSSVFASGDVGKLIKISGAGAAGVPLQTTIASFLSSTQITVTVAPNTTVASAQIVWGTDDTVAIQSAIDACFDGGGGTVYAPNGIYLIAGALKTSVRGVNPNAQLYMPTGLGISVKYLDRVQVKIVGESCSAIQLSGLGSSTPLKTGTIFYSLLSSSSGTNPAVIGTAGEVDGSFNLNYSDFGMENVNVRVYTNNGANVPYLSAVNMFNSGTTVLRNVHPAIDVDPLINTTQDPTGSGRFGITVGRLFCTGPNIIEACTVWGFEDGIIPGEHTVLNQVHAYACVNGWTFMNQTHAVSGQIFAHFCKNQILFPSGATYLGYTVGSGGVPIDIIGEFELNTYGKWFDTTSFFIDNNNPGRGKGVLKYTLYGTNEATWESMVTIGAGGSNLSYFPLANFSPKQINTAGGVMTQFSGWDIGQGIVQAYAGVDGKYGWLNATAMQSSGSGIVGGINFIVVDTNGTVHLNYQRFLQNNGSSSKAILNDYMRNEAGSLVNVLIHAPERFDLVTGVFKTASYANDAAADAAAPSGAAGDGHQYYNTTTHKMKVKENGTWKTVTTS